MSRFFQLVIQKIALMMIAIVALQFAVANFGVHQLHLGDRQEESKNHPHLQFTAQVVSLSQCVDCQCAFDSPELDKHQPTAHHQHQISKTETQTFDLCLDCQCHGGHATLLSQVITVPSLPVSDAPKNLAHHYFPPEQQAAYRPPIV
ncbi:hypothetical protein TUM4630_15460 [Shewanella algidipiscicola]|uniref:C2H2-type domain-containing protein n=2 Tax=Shewanella algidipiscicola TaxID=614070 RepID=A0ABQ4PEM2_9GAMM|nr:hypothetical protein TUM4630_15460 [Shewanella algidipiscicola]